MTRGGFKNMNVVARAAGPPRFGKQILVSLVSLALLSVTWPQNLSAYQNAQPPAATAPAPPAPPYAQQTPEQLQQLVAPIALYPDSLVAQILAASTFPEQVVEADRWVQAHADLKGDALAKAVDQEDWDPSIKALAAFPSVLGNMDKNLSWTSSLGDAYYNQQQDVTDAIQVMRQKAQQAGTLESTPQQTVTTQDSSIVIEPANPEIVYVPEYDPWLVYGYPIVAWPGWYPYPGIWYEGPYLSFGLGIGIGFFGGFGWGWGHWGFDWHNHYPIFNRDRYYSQSRTFYNRDAFYRGAGDRRPSGDAGARGRTPASTNARNRAPSGNAGGSGVYNRPGAKTQPFNGNTPAARGYSEPRGQSGVRSGAFGGYADGGQTRSYSSRGSFSMGGGAMRGGGGARGGGGGRR